jgi:hypothetical protein
MSMSESSLLIRFGVVGGMRRTRVRWCRRWLSMWFAMVGSSMRLRKTFCLRCVEEL